VVLSQDSRSVVSGVSEKLVAFMNTLPLSQVNSKAALDFGKEKGKLEWPLKGSILLKFGKNKSNDSVVLTSKGIVVKASEDQEVKVVFGGKVVFADWFKGYGKLIIVDHGNSYYTLYGHLHTIQAGDRVHMGDVIGLAGSTGSFYGTSLYFELRKKGKEENPLIWLKKL